MIIALEKSRKFAVRIYVLYKFLRDEKQENTLAGELLRSGTAIGAILSGALYKNFTTNLHNAAALTVS
jgi:hypothetical protein